MARLHFRCQTPKQNNGQEKDDGSILHDSRVHPHGFGENNSMRRATCE